MVGIERVCGNIRDCVNRVFDSGIRVEGISGIRDGLILKMRMIIIEGEVKIIRGKDVVGIMVE